MTSISSTSFSPRQFTSPRDLLQNELQAEVASGAVKSSDVDALSSALDDIDSTLKSAGQASRSSGSSPPSPSDMNSKIQDLISAQVDAGKLTSDQADELTNVFANALQQGGPGGPGGGPGGPGGGHGGPGGGHGGPGGPGGPGGAGCSGHENAATSTSDSATTSSSSDLSSLLADFLKTLQQTLSKDTSYGANGATSLSMSSLVVNYQA